MTHLIGIGGKLRSGKDAVADHLVNNYGWVKMGMSEPLNDALLELNPVIPITLHHSHPILRMVVHGPGAQVPYRQLHDLVGYTNAKEEPEVRRLLQSLGTEVGRKMIDENVWVDIAGRRVLAAQEEGKNVILTGIRFQNEIELINRLGGTSWWVLRPLIELEAGENAGHDSENSVTAGQFDEIILNDSTLSGLYARVDYAIEGL
jgi:hypothetical protein